MVAAATSSSSLPSSHGSPYTGEWEYDAFLCFRGGDTRHGFTSHLMNALSDRQIRAFIDDKLDKTESIDMLISILERSALSVVVFSEKFADSIWCLEEVATIARRMVEYGHRVLPVFYKVDPSDVTDDSRSYDKKRWMDALKAVANCAGHTSKAIEIESDLIKAIVEDVQKQLIGMSPSIKDNNLVAMGSRIFEVERLLAMDKLDETCIVGLWGMGGVGKTTLAKACYDRITSSNKGMEHLFVRNINEICEKHHGVEEIVHKLYSKLLKENNIDCEDLGISYRRERLSRLRVFIVLDNVETVWQLEQLALGDVFKLTKVFAAGSRIILTTRNKKVLQIAMAKVYNVECLNDEESTRLFSLHAFKRDFPQDNWAHKSRLAMSYCKGNPLALKILGGALFGEDRRYWMSFFSGLRQTGKLEIHNILRRSYNKLEEVEKRIFLDVACLLGGISRPRLIEHMATMHPSSYAKVKDLIDRSLLTCVSSENGEKIEVHDLLKEMAWNIVNEEPNLGKRSRLMNPEDIHKLLTTQEVKYWPTFSFNPFKIVEMVLPRRKKRKVVGMDWKCNNPLEEYRTTEVLKFWYNYSADNKRIRMSHGRINSLPNGLRWLEWHGYPLKSLPSKFYPQHIVHLIISDSPIQRCWEEGYDQPQLVNLMVLDLSCCRNLISIPNISNSLNLEELLLPECESLVEVPSYVQYFTKLIIIDIGGCRNLKLLPPKLDSKLLKHVWMRKLNVTHCPEINSRELEVFDLKGTSLVELPSAIYNVKQDGLLYLSGEDITKLPAITTSLNDYWLDHTSIREMDFLNHHHHHQASSDLALLRFHMMYLTGNSLLESLSKSIWNVVSYQLVIDGSPLIESLPDISEPVNGLTDLCVRNCGGLKSIPSTICNIQSLTRLELRLIGIRSLPSSIQEMKQLVLISLRGCKSLESIPSNIYKLSNLLKLHMTGCESIRSLPELPPNLEELEVSDCKSLQALPSNTGKLLHMDSLQFENCPQLDQTIPAEIVANFLVHASLSLSPEYQLLCSRSELPKWFSYEGDDCSVTMELPFLKDSDQPMIKGTAIGAMLSLGPCNSSVNITCDLEVGNTTVASSSFTMVETDGCKNSSEKVWLMFDKNSSHERAMESEEEEEEEDEAWYVKYAGLTVSIRIYFTNDSGEPITAKNFKIKRCGVSPVY
ncbi:Disease resistance protein RUN1 [Linum perenne]